MKKIYRKIALVMALTFIAPTTVSAELGDFGFFGGISEGTRLPKTTELLLAQTNSKKATDKPPATYKEVILLTGTAFEYEGLLTKKTSGEIKDDIGTYTETYTTSNSDATDETENITRNIVFNVNYRKEGKQIVKDYEVRTWRETITLGEVQYTLDPAQSSFSVSILEDHSPGVVYYKGNISQKAVYVDDNDVSTTVEMSGAIYGYNSAWSSTETHRLDYSVYNDNWQLQYQVRPSVSVNKLLQYSENEPTAISFSGNYMDVMQNKSGLQYNIFVQPLEFYTEETSGGITIGTTNTFEQLTAADLSHLKGHWAEDDIKKLFSMQVLEGDTKNYVPNQAATRGQFITMLVKAIKLPVEEPSTRTRNKTEYIVFPDVQPERPDYKYIMAAYKSGLAVGRQNGHFYVDASLTRQEAIVYLLRALGLENLGLNPTPVTSFVDDDQIADWAKREIYAAKLIGLISEDLDGKINPTTNISKAEAAALINRLVDYMRNDLQTDYTDNIVNYPR